MTCPDGGCNGIGIMRKLVALVIGNADYVFAGSLKNPANDASDVAHKLSSCGFDTITEVNASYRDMDQALSTFHANLRGKDVGLFFFAGHGVQIAGENYLTATDTRIDNEVEAKH